MFQKLVSHNKDIENLVSKGFAISFDSNCLVIRDIPYLNQSKNLSMGVIVVKLKFASKFEVLQDNHQIYFSGSSPFGIDGKPIPNIGDRAAQLPLACKDVIVQRSFSNKIKEGGKPRVFRDLFEKIEHYISIISGPAIELNPTVTPYTYNCQFEDKEQSVFEVSDTLTSRAGISDLSEKFKNETVAIIGSGGTGSYLLDFLVKTPVKEIKLFDNDVFHVHNVFRSPGKFEEKELKKSKVDIYKARYSNFRKGLTVYPKYVDMSSAKDFENVTFAFVCIDKGSSRSEVFDLLISLGISFIDVGMGLNRKRETIDGLVRMTYYPKEKSLEMKNRKLSPLTDNPDDIYKTNIQIGELNALNACLAVIKYKQIMGFYDDSQKDHHFLFGITDLKTVSN